MQKVKDAKLSMTLQAHMAEKSMYAGGHSLSYFSGPIWNTKEQQLEWITEKDKVEYVPSIYKIIDEIIVNTFDHTVDCVNNRVLIPSTSKKQKPKMISRIEATFDEKTGEITIFNNGNGIPIEKKDDVYCPEKFFTQDKTGTKLNRDPYRTTGGINGLGSCITVALSEYLILETQDEFNYYSQKFETLEKKHPPQIKKAKNAQEFTRITFKPRYVREEKEFGYAKFTPEVAKTISEWLKTRMIFLSLAVNAITPVAVKFNGTLITVKNSKHIPYLFKQEKHKIIDLKIKNDVDIGYNKPELLNLKVVFLPDDNKKGKNISIINGVVVNSNGYLDKLISFVIDYTRKQVSGDIKITDSQVSNCFSAVMIGSMMDPQADSQSKDRLPIRKNFGIENYKFNENAMAKKVYDLISDLFLDMILDKNAKVKIDKVPIDRTKYTPAKYIRTSNSKEWKKTVLILPEGDSAMGTIRKGIASNPDNWNYCGMLSLRGVIMNLKKNCTIHERDGKKIYVFNEKFKHNIFVQNFLQVTGLDFNKTYETEKEFNTLNYGAVCAAVDEDLDGKGHIASLLIVFLMVWPALFQKWNWVKRFPTPIVRAFPKGKNKEFIEFDRIEDLNDWLDENPDAMKKYEIDYYKGLGGIEDGNIVAMWKNWREKLLNYEWDKDALKWSEVYYGKMTEERKTELSIPRPKLTQLEINYFKDRKCKLTTQFRYEAKAFQLDNIHRKLPGILDGQNDVSRKVLSSMIDQSVKGPKKIKCSVIASQTVIDKMYLHGDSPIQEAIVHSAQQILGKNVIPTLVSDQQIGTRGQGGSDHGAARYIHFRLNKKAIDLLLPKADRWIIPYVYEEGKRCEPVMFYPTLPLILWKYYSIPATGWKCSIWARDVKHTIKIVKDCVKAIKPAKTLTRDKLGFPEFDNDGLDEKLKLPREIKPSTYKFTGEIRKDNGESYYVGKYELDGDTITITELPVGMWNNRFISKIGGDDPKTAKEKALKNEKIYIGKSLIQPDSIVDRSGMENVCIEMKFVKNWKEKIPKSRKKFLDDIESYLGLKTKMDNQLNLILPNGSVRTFNKYIEILQFWFKERAALYVKRFKREYAILKYKIMIQENIIRYIANFKDLNIMGIKEEKAIKLLTENKYVKINASFVTNAQEIDLNTLEYNVLNSPDANYDYLTSIPPKRAFKMEYDKYVEKLKELKERMKELESLDVIRKTWLYEIESFEEILEEGFKTEWMFDNYIDPEKRKCVKGGKIMKNKN